VAVIANSGFTTSPAVALAKAGSRNKINTAMQKSKHIIYITLVLALLVNACRTSRNYQRPQVALPAQFGNVAPSDTSIAEMEWKKFFADTTLQGLITKAVAGNFDLQLAMKRVEVAQAYVKQAKVNWTPSLRAQASASTTIPSKNSLNGVSLENFIGTTHVEDFSLGAALSWEFDVWGKLRRQREAAVANYQQTYETARAVQTTLVAGISNSYYNLLMLDAQLDIARRNVLLSDTVITMMRLQKQAGQVTELAVQQATVQQQTAALLIPQLEQQIAIGENTLRILLGELPAGIDRSAVLKDYTVWDNLPTGLPADMISRRPDVRSREMALVAANAQVGVASASMYPTIGITAGGGLNAFKASKWFVMPASLFGTVAGNIAQPILQRRQLKTQLEVATIQREEAVISFRQSALTAIGEVVNALVRLDKLKPQYQVAAERVTTLQQAISNAGLLFKSGMADYLEVITAQSNLLQAELGLADIRRQQLSAMVELYRALGGGWR
jgi:outer membrane protein, multidrug efflux system